MEEAPTGRLLNSEGEAPMAVGTSPVVETNTALPTPVRVGTRRRRPWGEWLTSYAFLITAFIVIGGFTFVAMTMALVLDRIMVGRGVFRTVYYLPAITSSVVMGLIFSWLFSPGGWVGSLVGIIIPGARQFGWLLDPLS